MTRCLSGNTIMKGYKMKMKYKEIEIERHVIDGFTLYAFINDGFIKNRYIGFTMAEAKKDFYNKVNREMVK